MMELEEKVAHYEKQAHALKTTLAILQVRPALVISPESVCAIVCGVADYLNCQRDCEGDWDAECWWFAVVPLRLSMMGLFVS